MNLPDGPVDSNALVLSFSDANALANLPPEVEIATMRQMVQKLVARVEALQQSQAIQMAGVHDRLDAVELEIPVIQEQTALRMRDLETRVNSEMEAQRDELAELRESKTQTESRLARAIADIERLCNTVSPPAASVPAVPEAIGPARSRIAEHIRQAAIDLAPGRDNPLIGDWRPSGQAEPAPAPKPAFTPATFTKTTPGFEAWKRQFMQDSEPHEPISAPDQESARVIICPRCLSDRTRPATLGRLDRIFHMAGFTPHRCKSCAHRFYKRDTGVSSSMAAADAMET